MSTESVSQNTLAPLVLRLALAGIFIYHGVTKVAGKNNELGSAWAVALWGAGKSEPPKSVMDLLNRMQEADNPAVLAEADNPAFPPPERIAQARDDLRALYSHSSDEVPSSMQYHGTQLLVAWGELLCGFALLLGLLTRLSAALMIIIQLGAIATVTWARGFSFAEGGGFEYNLALIAMCAAVVLMGAGTLSLDQRLAKRPKRTAAQQQVPAAV